jgi:hypothetical protein
VLSGVAGLVGLASGGAAVFVTDNEAGSVALLTVGVLFSFFGLAGLLPTRLKLGDNEIEWQQQVGDVLTDAVDAARPESRAALVQRIADLSAAAPTVAGRSLAVLAREAVMYEVLRAAIPDHLRWESQGPGGHRFDALIMDPATGRRLGVELKANAKPLGSAVFGNFLRHLDGIRSDPAADALLLVVNQPLLESARRLAEEQHLPVVTASGPEDTSKLREAIVQGLKPRPED